MKPLDSFEKNLKQLADRQVDTSASFVWEELAERIRPQKKKRRFFIFLLPALFLIGAGSWLAGNYYKDRDRQVPASGAQSSPEIVSKQETILSGEPEHDYSGVRGNEDKPSLTSKNKALSPASLNKQLKGLASQPRGSEAVHNGHNTVRQNLSIKKSDPSVPSPGGNVLSDAADKEQELATERLETAGTGSEQISPALINRASGPDEFFLLEPQRLPALGSMTGEITGLPQPECPTFRKKRTSFFIELEGQAGFPLKHLDAGTEAAKLYDLRRSTEHPWYSWGGGLHAGILYRDRFSISAGVDFSQLNEKFDYSKTDIVDLIYHVNPVTGEVTGPFVITGERTSSGQIRHKLIDIPLTLGYRIRAGHWNFDIEAGPFLNLRLTSGGKIMTDTDQIGRIEDNAVYRDAAGLGLQAGFAVSRKLNKHLSVYVKPEFKYYLNDWSEASYPVRTSFNQAYLGVGVRQQF